MCSNVSISVSIVCKDKPPFPLIAEIFQDCPTSTQGSSTGGCTSACSCPCPMTASLTVEAKEKIQLSLMEDQTETFPGTILKRTLSLTSVTFKIGIKKEKSYAILLRQTKYCY